MRDVSRVFRLLWVIFSVVSSALFCVCSVYALYVVVCVWISVGYVGVLSHVRFRAWVVVPCSLFPLPSTALSYVLRLVLQVFVVQCSGVAVCMCVFVSVCFPLPRTFPHTSFGLVLFM